MDLELERFAPRDGLLDGITNVRNIHSRHVAQEFHGQVHVMRLDPRHIAPGFAKFRNEIRRPLSNRFSHVNGDETINRPVCRHGIRPEEGTSTQACSTDCYWPLRFSSASCSLMNVRISSAKSRSRVHCSM